MPNRAIALAYEVDEVKTIRDKALALEVYAKQALNVEAERQACEIRLRAERRAGALLDQREKPKPGRYRSTDTTDIQRPETLAELGITRKQSSQWQALAKVPEETFEEALAAPERPTTSGIIAKYEAANPGA